MASRAEVLAPSESKIRIPAFLENRQPQRHGLYGRLTGLASRNFAQPVYDATDLRRTVALDGIRQETSAGAVALVVSVAVRGFGAFGHSFDSETWLRPFLLAS